MSIFSKFIKNIWKMHVWTNVTILGGIYFRNINVGFWSVLSTQQCRLAVLEKWRISVDNSKMFGPLLTDISKAFDYLHHELLIAKLNAYGFSLTALKLVHNYLISYQTGNDGQNEIQRTAVCRKLYLGFYKDWF